MEIHAAIRYEPKAEPVLAAIRAFVDAVNRGDQPAALARLAHDVTIIEDLPPYRWHGPEAGAEWMLAMWHNGQRTGLTQVEMALGADLRVEVDRDHAYVVLPGFLSLSGNGQSVSADGRLTFALRKDGQDWLIAAFAWTGPTPS